MRTLLIDYNCANINRSAEVVRSAWLASSEVVLFGPGYVTETQWQAGVNRFVRTHGPFDCVVATDLVASTQISNVSPEVHAARIDRVFKCSFDPYEAVRWSRRNYDEFNDLTSPRILSMLDFDSYNMRDEHRYLLETGNYHVVAWGPEFVRPLRENAKAQRETFAGAANDNWWEFATRHPQRIVSSVAAIAETEFNWTPLSSRKRGWTVPGARYWARQQARHLLREERIPHTGRAQVNGISALIRLDERLLRAPLAMSLLNFSWDQMIRGSRYAYTCGSGFGLPIRKFLEIPGAGTTLVASPPHGARNLGFESGVNFIAAEPSEILSVVEVLTSDPDYAQEVASRGRQLIWDRHRLAARAHDFRRALVAISSNDFAGSEWINGEFVVHSRTSNRSRSRA